MSIVEQLERQVQQLAEADFARFREWFHEYEWRTWDRQIERDARGGKLKELADKALAEHAAGRTGSI